MVKESFFTGSWSIRCSRTLLILSRLCRADLHSGQFSSYVEFDVLVNLDDGKVFIAGMKDRTEAAKGKPLTASSLGSGEGITILIREFSTKRIRKSKYLL